MTVYYQNVVGGAFIASPTFLSGETENSGSATVTPASGSNRIIIAYGMTINDTVGTATWNAVPMTEIANVEETISATINTRVFYLGEDDFPGSAESLTISNAARVGWIQVGNVNQLEPFRDSFDSEVNGSNTDPFTTSFSSSNVEEEDFIIWHNSVQVDKDWDLLTGSGFTAVTDIDTPSLARLFYRDAPAGVDFDWTGHDAGGFNATVLSVGLALRAGF